MGIYQESGGRGEFTCGLQALRASILLPFVAHDVQPQGPPKEETFDGVRTREESSSKRAGDNLILYTKSDAFCFDSGAVPKDYFCVGRLVCARYASFVDFKFRELASKDSLLVPYQGTKYQSDALNDVCLSFSFLYISLPLPY